MNLLLDTHALWWALAEPARLSGVAEAAVSDPQHTRLVSAASVWEMAIKHHAGRWPEAEPILADIDEVLEALGATSVGISHGHARRAGLLSWDHRDPFDRVLAAQALSMDTVLVTRDAAFDQVQGLRTLW